VFTTTWPVSGFHSGQRTNAELFTVGALIGLVLSAAGVYGVTNLAVHQRQREIGIRMAIGAFRHHIARLVPRNTWKARLWVARVAGLGLVGRRLGDDSQLKQLDDHG